MFSPSLWKPNEPEVREQYQIEITNRFAGLENLDNDEDVDRTWENIKENIQTSAKESLGLHELKQNKPWFDEECLGFLEKRKQAKLKWIQDPSQSNVDNLNNVRCEVSRYFRNKKKAYLTAKIEELETNSKIKNVRDLYRGINDFKKRYQPRCNIVQDEKVTWLQNPTVLLLDEGTISPSYSTCMGLRMLGRQKYTQQNH